MSPSDANKPVPLPRQLKPVTEPSIGGPLMLPSAPVVAAEATPAGPPGLSAPPTFSGLVKALRRRLALALGLATLGAALTVAAVFFLLPARYTVQSRLKLSSHASPTIFFGQGQPYGEASMWKANQEAILKSPLILSRALDSDKVKHLAVAQASIDWLEKALKVDFLLGPEIMRVALGGDDPEALAPLLNAVIDAYLAEMNQQEVGRRTELLRQLEASQKTYFKKLSRTEHDLRVEEREHGIDDPEAAKQRLLNANAKLFAAEKEYRDIRIEKGKKERDLKALEARDKNIRNEPVPNVKVASALRESPLVQGMLKQLETVQLEIAGIRATARDADQFLRGPLEEQNRLALAVEKMREQLRPGIEERVRAEIHETIQHDMGRLQSELETLAAQGKGLTDAVKSAEDEVRKLDPVNQPRTPLMEKLRGDVAQYTKAVDSLNGEIAKLKVEPPPSARVIRLQAAEPPTARDYSRHTKLSVAGAAGMFGLLLFGVGFWEFRTRKVTAASEVTEGLGLKVLGTLPALPPKARRHVPGAAPVRDLQWQSRMMESVDAIRTLLLHTARTDSLQVLMVTSAMGGEGKTSVASQLAASLARAWRKTLLVDGDLRNPAAHKLFELPLEPGFSEVLRGEANLGDVVRPTPLSRLWMVPAGNWDSHAVQALAQEGVGAMFAQLKEQYEFIIVDSCPVLPVADSLLLGQHVDAVVFSVLRDVSRLPAIHAAQQRLGALGVRTLGAVVIGADGDAGTAYQYPAQSAS